MRDCCAFCARPVVHGVTTDGQRLVLDLSLKTWSVVYQGGAEQPRLARSRGYVEHQCGLDHRR